MKLARFVVKTKEEPLVETIVFDPFFAKRLSKKKNVFRVSQTLKLLRIGKRGSAANRRFGVDMHEQCAVASCTSPGGGWLSVCVSRDEDGAFSRRDKKVSRRGMGGSEFVCFY